MNIQTVISTIVDIISFILWFTTGYFFYRALCYMAQKRKGWPWSVVVFLSCVILTGMIIFANDVFNVTLDLLWFLAMMLICFRGKIILKLTITALLYPIIIALNFLVMEVLGYLNIWNGEGFAMDIFCTLADGLIHVAVWYVIYKSFQKHLSQMEKLFDDKTWTLLGTICLASFVSITTCIYFAPKETYKIWPCALACIVTNIGCLYLGGYFANNIKRDIEQKNMKLQKVYYEELEENQTEIRKIRHDMNHHLSVIKDLLDAGDRQGAKEYYEVVGGKIAAKNRSFCDNGIVNAVLNKKYNRAAKYGIDCFFHIDLQHAMSIDPISLCSLFSNTLDNALEASMKIPNPDKRKISVKARVTDNGFFSYEIKNNKINKIEERNGTYFSDKEDKKSHGLGLSNVREVVEKYEGMLNISHTEDSFSVLVLIENAN